MKKTLILFIVVGAVFSIALSSCTSFKVVPFEPVVEGRALPQPVDVEKLRSAIRVSLATFNWVTKTDTGTEFTASFGKGNGEVSAEIKIEFSSSGYKIEYVDSQGLLVDLENKTIHRTYVRWVNNLNKEIYVNYIR